VIVGVIRRKPVLTHASIVREGMLASVKSVKYLNEMNAECGNLLTGNLRKIKFGTFRKLPVVNIPHSAPAKFRISANQLRYLFYGLISVSVAMELQIMLLYATNLTIIRLTVLFSIA